MPERIRFSQLQLAFPRFQLIGFRQVHDAVSGFFQSSLKAHRALLFLTEQLGKLAFRSHFRTDAPAHKPGGGRIQMLIREKFKRRLREKPPSAPRSPSRSTARPLGYCIADLRRDAAGQRAVGSDYFFKVLRLVRFPGKCLNQIGDIEIFLVDQRHLIFCFQLLPRQVVNRTGADSFDARISLHSSFEILTRQGARQIQLRGDPGSSNRSGKFK